MAAVPIDTDQIVVTASRAPDTQAQTAASATVLDAERIERLGAPLAPALLRQVPSLAVTQSGAAGSVAEVRIRGAEANHSLLFIDGIRANDPARGDAPRFELLSADILSRIEVVRGPQSALWGSQAIGGVVAADGLPTTTGNALRASGEAGSFGTRRTSLTGAIPGVAGTVAWQQAAGIDIFGGGDRDGYRNVAARLRGSAKVHEKVELGASGFLLAGRNEYDGFDPSTFERSHDLTSRDRMGAARAWVEFGGAQSPWHGTLSLARLSSRNRNFFAGEQINRTRGGRMTVSGQLERDLRTGAVQHLLIAAAEHERETFGASDTVYGGATAQDRDRTHQAITAEWRGTLRNATADIAVRRDAFNRFKDATTLRASLLADLGRGFSAAGTYGEGIAQPTFFDLFGFFPGTFEGNPGLTPESSHGFEGSLRYRRGSLNAALTGFRQRLRDEIVDVFDSSTGTSSTANRADRSRRWGLEAELGFVIGEKLRLGANYAHLKATQPNFDGSLQVKELRRPKHSGAVSADGAVGRFSYGASLAFSGARTDLNENFPYNVVRLSSYWLADARVAYTVRPGVELFARGSNLLNDRYQDVFGYRTEGRSLVAGVRLAPRS
jgi:vitamin B12 transporter